MNDGHARFRHARSVDFPHTIKLGNVVVSFLQNLLRAIEAGTINDDSFRKVAIVRRCIGTHSTVEKCVDVGCMLLALDVFKTARKELAGVMRV